MVKEDPKTEIYRDRPSWENRRKVVFSTLLFCAFCILYILFSGADTRIYETIVVSAFALGGSVIGFYIAGASWEGVNVVNRERSPNEIEPEPEPRKRKRRSPDETESEK